MLIIRNVQMEDLPEIAIIESLCFPGDEAASKETFEKRIHLIPDSFFVAEMEGVIVGFVNGPVIETPYITDELFREVKVNPLKGGHQSVLGIAVTPHFQTRGVAAALLAHIEKVAKTNHRQSITLTCKEDLIGFYNKYGYANMGVSKSEHGGIIWYNMVKMFSL
jgi:ribosomal protein S18 acetylase RimI-like enzyme